MSWSFPFRRLQDTFKRESGNLYRLALSAALRRRRVASQPKAIMPVPRSAIEPGSGMGSALDVTCKIEGVPFSRA